MNLPKRVAIELTNRCNRTCRECPRNKTNYPLGNMSLKLFTSVISQLPSSTVIVPFFRGESLMYPRFVEAMKRLQRFKSVQLATNGDLLNPENRKAILDACMFISISLHNYLFPKKRGRTLKMLREANGHGLTTQVSIVETYLKDKQKFVDEWLPYVDRVRIYVEHSHNGYGSTHLKIDDLGQPCGKPFNEMVVYWDGKVALCCHDWDNNGHLGDLNGQSVEKVWNAQPYRYVRTLHEEGFRTNVKSCENCHQWMADYTPNKILGELYT